MPTSRRKQNEPFRKVRKAGRNLSEAMSKTQTGREKTTLSLKAHPDTDADLIAWWQAIPAGARSDALRTLIRSALREGYPTPVERVLADTSWLREALMELPAYLEGVLSRVPRAEPVPVALDPEAPDEAQARLDQASAARRRAHVKQRGW